MNEYLIAQNSITTSTNSTGTLPTAISSASVGMTFPHYGFPTAAYPGPSYEKVSCCNMEESRLPITTGLQLILASKFSNTALGRISLPFTRRVESVYIYSWLVHNQHSLASFTLHWWHWCLPLSSGSRRISRIRRLDAFQQSLHAVWSTIALSWLRKVGSDQLFSPSTIDFDWTTSLRFWLYTSERKMNLTSLFEGYPDTTLSPWNDPKTKDGQKSSKLTVTTWLSNSEWIDRMQKLPELGFQLARMVID